MTDGAHIGAQSMYEVYATRMGLVGGKEAFVEIVAPLLRDYYELRSKLNAVPSERKSCAERCNISADEERCIDCPERPVTSSKENYRKCFTALVTLLPMAKAAIPHPSCTVAYAVSIAQADQAINEALHQKDCPESRYGA